MKTIITTCDCCQKEYPEDDLLYFYTRYYHQGVTFDCEKYKVYVCTPCSGIKKDKEIKWDDPLLTDFLRSVLKFYGERK